MGYGPIRVINEDHILTQSGFDAHEHQNMEILSYVISGELRHEDNLGHVTSLKAGDLQFMSAGTGIQHSEFNPHTGDSTHFYQIWIQPRDKDTSPSYQYLSLSKIFQKQTHHSSPYTVLSPHGENGSIKIKQDLFLTAYNILPDCSSSLACSRYTHGWLQVIKGEMMVQNLTLKSGDALMIEKESTLSISGKKEGLFFLFEFSIGQ
jgi:redox-sensitive bicupin YhaK (pirin superfamily)